MAGPKLGIQAYTVSYQLNSAKEQFDPKVKFGFTAGMEFNIPLAKNFNLNPEKITMWINFV